jgi:PIN domain nuclease of toxin-antitoxin system
MTLLDTSTLLWTLGEPERLSATARETISAGELCVSVASYWEIVIKANKGQLKIADPVSWWNRATQLLGTEVLPIRASHISAIATLPNIHRDPFDRILIAQSNVEGYPLVTCDEKIAAYQIRVIW